MEWQFWFVFSCLLWIGFISQVGLCLGSFTLGAFSGLVAALFPTDLEFQLSAFLLISVISMIMCRCGRGVFNFDKSFRDRL